MIMRMDRIRMRRHVTFANLVAVSCAAVVLAQPATAAVKRLIGGADVRDGSLTGLDVRNRSIGLVDLAPSARVAGPRGEAGLDGAPGARGEAGSPGSPDTAEQVRDKLASVDGAGSGIDADSVDGLPGSSLAGFLHFSFLDAQGGNAARLAPLGPGGDTAAIANVADFLRFGTRSRLSSIRVDTGSNGSTNHTFTIVKMTQSLVQSDVASCTTGGISSGCQMPQVVDLEATDGIMLRITASGNPFAQNMWLTMVAQPRP
jgi:hypothetical protein